VSGAHIAAHAAAEKRKREQEEEELMTGYTPTDLSDQWEFKIVRSVSSAFKKPEVFQQLVQQEAMAGWELLEKLDDGRVRFKRPVSARRRDGMLPRGVDPYRTRYGMSEGLLAFWIIAGVLLAMGITIGIVALVESNPGF
jgi:hypothetical protein